MNIIIAGCGKVGFTVAEQLRDEGHEITMIDIAPEHVESTMSQLDIQVIVGNSVSQHTLEEADIENTDLFIAVTNQDEVNLLSCLIAKKAGKCHTIARVRNPEYNQEISFIKEGLGLSMVINPELATAGEIARLIQVPYAMEIDSFAKNKVNMIKFVIPENSVLNHCKISDFGQRIDNEPLFCIVERKKQVIIPDGSFVLEAGDSVSAVMPLTKIPIFFSECGLHTKPIHNVMIAGGGTLSYYLAGMLAKMKVAVKIIEKDRSRCEQLSELVPQAMIICGDATDRMLLLEEGIKNADAFVSLTGIDEENILLSLYANKASHSKIITKLNRISFDEVIEDIPLGSIVYPKYITAEYILRYVRAMENSMGSNVESLYRMVNNQVEALEFIVREQSHLTDIPLQNLNLIDHLLICCIVRDGKVITPTGKDVLKVNDTVIIVTTHLGLNDLEDIINYKRGN